MMAHKFLVEVEHHGHQITNLAFEVARDDSPLDGLKLRKGWGRALIKQTWETIEAAGLVSTDLRWWRLSLSKAAPPIAEGWEPGDVPVLYWHSIPKKVYGAEDAD